MKNLQQRFLDLLTDLKKYIKQEHHSEEIVTATQENFDSLTKIETPPQKKASLSPTPPTQISIPKQPSPVTPPPKSPEPTPTPSSSPLPQPPTPEVSLIQTPQKPQQSSTNNLKDMLNLMKKTNINIIETIPPYTPQPKVLLLTASSNSDHDQFLNKVGTAITQNFVPAALINLNSSNVHDIVSKIQSKQLKLIIASKAILKEYGNFFRQLYNSGKDETHFLGDTPLYIMSDINHYLDNPENKKILWVSIKSILGEGI